MTPAEVEELFPLKHEKSRIYGQWMVNLSLMHQRQSMVVMAMKGEFVGLLRHMGDADPYVVVQATSTFMLEIFPTPVVFANTTWDSGLLLGSIPFP
ncbi:unnamed protein product [Sphagnum balticum]